MLPYQLEDKMTAESRWIPEIMYEDSAEEGMSHIPFVMVPLEEVMPQLLYIFEARETGEFEPGPEGEDLPVTEMDLHQYADLAVLKEKFDEKSYDAIREALGLEPMRVASVKGAKITQNIRENLDAAPDQQDSH
jgi:hypothetical protein